MFVLQAHQVKNLPDVVGFSRSGWQGAQDPTSLTWHRSELHTKACGCGSFFGDMLSQFLLEMWRIYSFFLPKTGKCALHKASRDPFILVGHADSYPEVASAWKSPDLGAATTAWCLHRDVGGSMQSWNEASYDQVALAMVLKDESEKMTWEYTI